MSPTLPLALIYGSTRERRFCDIVARWTKTQLDRHPDFATDVIDPAVLHLPDRHADEPSPALVALGRRLGRADAFVVVTPEYNHGYPAALKFLIDSFSAEWRAKPVAFVSYGGVSGGLRAVEQLRLVFAELHAVAIRDSVSFANAWEQFDASGRLTNGRAAEQAMARMLASLAWWATALRAARKARPYEEVVA